MTGTVGGVELFAWAPRRTALPGRWGRYTPLPQRVTNFGDLLGPLIVRALLDRAGVRAAGSELADLRLFSVGSVLHFAQTGDVVWGAGVNGKIPAAVHTFGQLDVRAVRGPLTRQFLLDRGLDVPPVYGDPALLLPLVRPELCVPEDKRMHDVTVVPNLNERRRFGRSSVVLDPCLPVEHCLRRIAHSRLVVASSLHGVVVAEALGVPARLITSSAEHSFKYADYFAGTGRPDWRAASSPDEAVRWGGAVPPEWDAEPLLAAFPIDLWAAPAATASAS